MNLRLFKRNVSFSFFCNLISFFVSVLGTFLLPKYMSPENYGGWQLYLFYFYYSGFFHFGWLDGMYLRYGGIEYEKLKPSIYGPEFLCLIFFEIIISFVVFLYSYFFVSNTDLKFILHIVALTGVLTVFRSFFSFILQMTNRIEEYAKTIILERILCIVSIVVFIAIKAVTYKRLAIFDIFVKVFSLLFSMYCCRNLLGLGKITNAILLEIKTNIRVGINLMFANIASMLIIGIIRFSVSQEWNLSTFGQISLTMAISSFLMIFIDSVSIALFPALRTIEREKQTSIYCNIRSILMPILLFLLITYYPLQVILLQWLPKYKESLIYLAILFPICVYQCNVSLLVNTYLKCLRQERLMFKINLATVVMSLILSGIFAYWLHDLTLVVFSMVFLFAFKGILAEYCLDSVLKVNFKKNMISETLMVIIFITISWYFNKWNGWIIYLIVFSIYLYINKEQCKSAYEWFMRYDKQTMETRRNLNS